MKDEQWQIATSSLEASREALCEGQKIALQALQVMSKMKGPNTEGNLGQLKPGLLEAPASEMTADSAPTKGPFPAFSPHLHFGGGRGSSP